MTHNKRKNHVNFLAMAFWTALLAAAGLGAGSASAASETVLYSFCQQPNCADGQYPEAGLIATNQGALYGTTGQGGNANKGVAFLVSLSGGTGLLHAFQNNANDGGYPEAPLFVDNSGNFYGTTTEGGANEYGTVFERTAGGTYRLRHAFNGTDGANPSAGLVADSAGNLYGTTFHGGANGQGTIFRLAPSGILTTLYSFCGMSGCSDGAGPYAGLIGDANGNLYGTTFQGGGASACNLGCGVVFKIHADGSNYIVLHAFAGGTSDGAGPPAGLSADASGNLYGTTYFGGGLGCFYAGCGSVFKIAPDGSNYAVLYHFCSQGSCADGSEPTGGVIVDAAGNLYGTTLSGGANNWGAVFSLTPSGTYTVLYSFCSLGACADGSQPQGNLVALSPGNLYETTTLGGANNSGTVYKLTSTGFVP
jgi:uncharacterized repeat protein (TIGR03803 family)